MPKGGIVDDAVVGFDKIKRYVRIVQQYGDNQILYWILDVTYGSF